MKLALIPHNDDEALFLSFAIQQHRPQAVIVFDSFIQVNRGHAECDAMTRRAESLRALECLGAGQPIFLGFSDAEPPSEEGLTRTLSRLDASEVWIPLIEEGGHAQHNLVGQAGLTAFAGRAIHRYATYTQAGKSTAGTPVPMTGAMVRRKLEALACYRTQLDIDALGCWPHFLDLREYCVD